MRPLPTTLLCRPVSSSAFWNRLLVRAGRPHSRQRPHNIHAAASTPEDYTCVCSTTFRSPSGVYALSRATRLIWLFEQCVCRLCLQQQHSPPTRCGNRVFLRPQVSFTPALPSAKLAAIRSMGMGTLNKVVLHFSSVFWQPADFFGHAGKDRRKWLLFMDMSRVTNRPILVAMSGGPFAVFVERLGDAEIVRRAMAVVRTVHSGAPDPTASQVTRWKADRFSRGSFSFIPPGCRSADAHCR